MAASGLRRAVIYWFTDPWPIWRNWSQQMDYAYMLGGGAPLKMSYQVNETLANAGIPVLAPGAGNAGVQISTTTSWANAVGVTLDTATYVTAQQTDGTSAEREVSVIISPQAVFRALMSGGATEGTALTLYDVTTASTTGLDVVTGDAFTDFDDGVIWGYDGANAGQKRCITVGDATDATVAVAFDNDIAVGDNFMAASYWYLSDVAGQIQTTTNLYQADASIAGGTGGEGRIIDMELRDISADGRTNSYVLFIFDDHALGQTRT
jgi:hypothetical protein